MPRAPVHVWRLHSEDLSIALDAMGRFGDRVPSPQDMAAFLEEERNYLLLAETSAAVLGFATAYRLDRFDGRAPKLFLYEIEVLEAYRRQGVGRSLIEAVERIARSEGLERVFALTNRSNEAAVALFRGTGASAPNGDDLLFEY